MPLTAAHACPCAQQPPGGPAAPAAQPPAAVRRRCRAWQCSRAWARAAAAEGCVSGSRSRSSLWTSKARVGESGSMERASLHRSAPAVQQLALMTLSHCPSGHSGGAGKEASHWGWSSQLCTCPMAHSTTAKPHASLAAVTAWRYNSLNTPVLWLTGSSCAGVAAAAGSSLAQVPVPGALLSLSSLWGDQPATYCLANTSEAQVSCSLCCLRHWPCAW